MHYPLPFREVGRPRGREGNMELLALHGREDNMLTRRLNAFFSVVLAVSALNIQLSENDIPKVYCVAAFSEDTYKCVSAM
jgi:hypothetical protein